MNPDLLGRVTHCPYCTHTGKACWWTPEQQRYVTLAVAVPAVRERLAGSAIQAKLERVPSKPLEPSTRMLLAKLPCCGERVKHDGSCTTLRCVSCGKKRNFRAIAGLSLAGILEKLPALGRPAWLSLNSRLRRRIPT